MFVALALGASARAGAPPQRNSTSQVETRAADTVEAVRVDHGPKLDGPLDDPIWQAAKTITDFRKQEPYEGQSATERTEVRILYTRHAVYFGIHCFDAEPARIIASELRRDVSQDLDDHLEILIDSNHDRRGAYVFQVNPLGTQMDGLIVEEQRDNSSVDFDSGWDGVWTSEARIGADGWTATIEIPFTTLNFTHFKVFIPEKRQFFLENAGVFNFSLGDQDQLFFSRQIGIDPITGNQVPINGGAKVTGRIGGLELGVMDVDTRSSGPNPYSNFAVVRLKESLWAGSYVGVIGIDKRSGDVLDSFNQSGGVDTRLVFFKDWFVDAHMAGTQSPGSPSGNGDVGASLTYRSNWVEGIFERRKIGPNFNPEVGFIERMDSNETYGDLTFKVRPHISGVRELQFEGFLLHAPDTLGQVSTQEWQNTFRADFHNGAYTDDDIADVFTQRITTPL